MTDYHDKQQAPKTKPKHEINDKKGKRLREQEEANKREISTYRGGYDVGD